MNCSEWRNNAWQLNTPSLGMQISNIQWQTTRIDPSKRLDANSITTSHVEVLALDDPMYLWVQGGAEKLFTAQQASQLRECLIADFCCPNATQLELRWRP